MESEIRLILLVIGALIILAILFDGLRRQRKQKVKTKSPRSAELERAGEVLKEVLKAKPKASSNEEFAQPESFSDIAYAVQHISSENEKAPFSLGPKAPLTSESDLSKAKEFVAQAQENLSETLEAKEKESEELEQAPVFQSVEQPEPDTEAVLYAPVDEEPVDESPVDEEELTEEVQKEASPAPTASASQPDLKPILDNQLLMFTLIAKDDHLFGGFKLLQVLLNHGLRFGEGNIFHYQEEEGGDAWFSLAAATRTGEFDLSDMAGFHCKGLVLFMNSVGHKNPSDVFETMVEVAEQLARDLDSDLRIGQNADWDESHLKRLHDNLIA